MRVVSRPLHATARVPAAPAEPRAFEVTLIRLAAHARDAEARAGRAQARFERGEIGTAELHAAEAELSAAYERLRQLRASVEGSRALAWKARHGWDLEEAWARHGIALPPTPRTIADGPRREQVRQVVGAIAGVGGLFGFAVFAQATNRMLAGLGFGAFVLGALINGGLLLIAQNRRSAP